MGKLRDTMVGTTFLTIYASPILQAMVGLRKNSAVVDRRIERNREADEAGSEEQFETRGPADKDVRAGAAHA